MSNRLAGEKTIRVIERSVYRFIDPHWGDCP